MLQVITRAIHFHGKQGLSLRGHRETLQESDENQNLGSFLTYLKERQNYCPELKEYLEALQSCGEWSFPSDTENNYKVKFLFFLLYSISPTQLLAATTPIN